MGSEPASPVDRTVVALAMLVSEGAVPMNRYTVARALLWNPDRADADDQFDELLTGARRVAAGRGQRDYFDLLVRAGHEAIAREVPAPIRRNALNELTRAALAPIVSRSIASGVLRHRSMVEADILWHLLQAAESNEDYRSALFVACLDMKKAT